MKHLSINFTLAFTLMLTFSCKNVLDQLPKDQLVADNFWKSKNDFDLALAACYSTLQDYYLCTGIHDLDCISDNGVCSFNYANEQAINAGITVSSHATDPPYYSGYTRLARYNNFIKQLSGYTGTDIPAGDKQNYLAQVRLLRAMEYYRLFIYYGSVPLVTEPVTMENQHVANSPASDVFKQIVSDCDFAISHLPDLTFWASQGHLTKAAAQMVKARAYLYSGYEDTGNAKVTDLQVALDLTNSIISSNKFSLAEYYRGLFSHSLGQQENNKEYIFAACFLAPNNSKQGLWSFNISTMQFYWQSVYALPSLLNEYEFSDGTPYNPSDPRADPNYLIANRDPRMGQTVCQGFVLWEDGTRTPFDNKYSFITCLFWKTCDLDEVKQNGGVSGQKQNTNNTACVPLIRYAEVLLSHAEALNEIKGPVQGVYNDINLVRARTKMPALPAGLSKENMRMRIRHERRVELAFEGFRYYDIKRWKIAKQVLDGVNDGLITRKFESPKNYLWPLPEQETRVNKAIKQNPNY